jgi:hypothetical protein
MCGWAAAITDDGRRQSLREWEIHVQQILGCACLCVSKPI